VIIHEVSRVACYALTYHPGGGYGTPPYLFLFVILRRVSFHPTKNLILFITEHIPIPECEILRCTQDDKRN